MHAETGELVEFTRRVHRPGWAKVTKRLGHTDQLSSLSEIAIRAYDLPAKFPVAALEESSSATRLDLGSRTDLRHINFITIDPENARDRDDAVFAEPDIDLENAGGYTIRVAIADVAHFVRPGGALCKHARERGNSTYFPDMVLPMLPETLSSNACSLQAGVDRPCIAVRITLDRLGYTLSHSFERVVIRTVASLSYHEAQYILDNGQESDVKTNLMHLRAAHNVLLRQREQRQPLDIELQERKILFSNTGHVKDVCSVERLECHQIIEEFMVLANVCAAETLHARQASHVCRIHDKPERKKTDELLRVAQSCGFTLSRQAASTTVGLNQLLTAARGSKFTELISTAVLRTMQKATYSDAQRGHFGLNLHRYVHFTSPIRRYSDLIAHRALISALDLGEGGLNTDAPSPLSAISKHLSECERRSAAAERESLDRFTAAFLADRIGSEFAGTVVSVLKFGAFVRLNEVGAEGLVLAAQNGLEYFRFDPDVLELTGERSGITLRIGSTVSVRLSSVDTGAGKLQLEIVGRLAKKTSQVALRRKFRRRVK